MPNEEFWDVDPVAPKDREAAEGYVTFEALAEAPPNYVHLVIGGNKYKIVRIDTAQHKIIVKEI